MRLTSLCLFLCVTPFLADSQQVIHQANGSKPEDLSLAANKLPNISVFATHPSDRFLVNVDEVTSGHPFKGINSAQPHAGAHVHFDNSANRWPKGGKDAAHYPAIYAVADGVVSRVDFRFGQKDGNHRYGVDLTFAVSNSGAPYHFCYSIEPMIPEPAEGFYRKLIMVQKGRRFAKAMFWPTCTRRPV